MTAIVRAGMFALAPVLAAAIVAPAALAQDRAASPLQTSFDRPPQDARPQTWFHVMSSNMTAEGLTKDLQAMADAGLGGLMMFHITQGVPVGPIKFGSPHHIGLVAHAAAEAKRLGLRFGLHNADGWTSSGGPWVTPEMSMKKVVWTERVVPGGAVDLQLAQPRGALGFYRDIATVAYPALAAELAARDTKPVITASGGEFSVEIATDGGTDRSTWVRPPVTDGPHPPHARYPGDPLTAAGAVHIDFDYGRPIAIRSAEMVMVGLPDLDLRVLASDDGQQWRELGRTRNSNSGKWESTASLRIAAAPARYYRFTANVEFALKEMTLTPVQLVDHVTERMSQARHEKVMLPVVAAADPAQVVPAAAIVDLSDKVDRAGRLRAQLPPGEWTVMRFGYTTTEARNWPPSREGKGLETDKFSAAATDLHYAAFLGRAIAAARAIAPGAIDSTLIDSNEVGGQNWTDGYVDLFRGATGLDLVRYLPLYAGRYVGDAQTSEAIYRQIRRLNSQLMEKNYFGRFRELAHRDGMKLYAEHYGWGPFDFIDAGREIDLPMGEFWVNKTYNQVGAPIAVARIYDKPLVAAEAFTADGSLNWHFHPAVAKRVGDKAWTWGINQFVFHRFAHQANTHVMPGMTMNRWGAHFDRTQPWWGNAGKDWFAYMARGQALLQQGHAVAEVGIYVGDSSPTSCPEPFARGDFLPIGYDADCINQDALLNRLTVRDGALRLPDGNGYRILYLHGVHALTPATLAKLEAAARAGVTLIGARPVPMLPADADARAAAAARALIDRIWAMPTVRATGTPLDHVAAAGVLPDLVTHGGTPVPYTHRRIGADDLYFVYNPDDAARVLDMSFKVTGKVAELWDPLTGARRRAEGARAEGAATRLSLPLARDGSMFVVFRPAAVADAPALAPGRPVSRPLGVDRWAVSFSAPYGFSRTIPSTALFDWKDSPDPDIRHFTGSALYSGSFTLAPGDAVPGRRMLLDLGAVGVAATVRVNGRPVGTSWIAPYRLEVGDAVRPGRNDIRIEVANLWANRLIGDEALPDTSGFTPGPRMIEDQLMPAWYAANQPPPPGPRHTFTTQPFFTAGDPLVSSGLLGPVQLIMNPE